MFFSGKNKLIGNKKIWTNYLKNFFHSKIVDVNISKNLSVIITPAWKDNYSYIFVDQSTHEAGCVDVNINK
jgi:hypothetical protein